MQTGVKCFRWDVTKEKPEAGTVLYIFGSLFHVGQKQDIWGQEQTTKAR